ncbi:lppg:fo 2-phospho-l-lactate transferase cofd/upf0052 [Desulfoluna butyratoxydans]|uniref:Lppg:fo 2-phospho-l-lactate transferase cofd/upf0052 n=2 Tax=Desulfoluna butyratoxydans TaxID=231438 RepID=A0A4U8YGX0_9BACT|nr:lppg:fo 2-phospho-l-lactate transferase cofd/upf0052 [Desulfoluna butyratoxydans]
MPCRSPPCSESADISLEDAIQDEMCIPDLKKYEGYLLAPHTGPRILFFSGGTALSEVSRELTRYTHNTIHIMTPFDSGGSSGELRRWFHIPAMGDIRSRLLALSDAATGEGQAAAALFSHRFSRDMPRHEATSELAALAGGTHHLFQGLSLRTGEVLCPHFRRFMESMPEAFDLRGACMGNLVLTSACLASSRGMASGISLVAALVGGHGEVHPVVAEDMHIAAALADGSVVVGQHLLTGKEGGAIQSRITRVWLTSSLDDTSPVKVAIDGETASRIADAELICFPIGSFFTSVIANILPWGVGKAVAANPCPKVFVPNPFEDPELLGYSVEDQVATLLAYLVESGAPRGRDALQFVLVDSRKGHYPGGLDTQAIQAMGVDVIDVPLIGDGPGTGIDKRLLTRALLSFT